MLITIKPELENICPPTNVKKKLKEKEHGRSSKRHSDRLSSGRSPKSRNRGPGRPNSFGLDFLDHYLHVVEGVAVSLNSYE